MIGRREWYVLLVAALAALSAAQDEEFLYDTFPDGFLWGAATSAYQIEGAWNLSGKGENIWDTFVHADAPNIDDGSTGDVACDSYHLYTEDVTLLKNLGVSFYRFSFSWTRLVPTGKIADGVNQDGIDYYNNLINELIANNIQPTVTLYHWDLPQGLEDEGGWLSATVVDHFADYADLAFMKFGDRVKTWFTINEPWVQAAEGYGWGDNAPGIFQTGTSDYLAAHHLLLAHATAWHLYDENYRSSQAGKISYTMDSSWLEPKTRDRDDVAAAERGMQFKLGWFAHPVFSADGDYPAVMKEFVAKHSADEGLPTSRLPVFTPEQVQFVKGTFDFFGLNHYTTNLAEFGIWPVIPSYARDCEVYTTFNSSWPESSADWLRVVPWGFRKLLNWIKNEYGDVPIVISENGYADSGEMDDVGRVDYYRRYINEVLKAIKLDGCNVIAYTAWSLLDNFEWSSGYTLRFGMHHVDFADPAKLRTPKSSAALYSQIIADNGFPAPPADQQNHL